MRAFSGTRRFARDAPGAPSTSSPRRVGAEAAPAPGAAVDGARVGAARRMRVDGRSWLPFAEANIVYFYPPVGFEGSLSPLDMCVLICSKKMSPGFGPLKGSHQLMV